MSYRTLEEWNARGRQIIKGEKAMGRLNDNTPLFGKEQTKKAQPQIRNTSGYSGGQGANWDQSEDWDEVQEAGLLIGLPGQW